MNVEATKKMILLRINELHRLTTAPPMRPRAEEQREAPRKRRFRRTGKESLAPELDFRLSEIEDRLAAVEGALTNADGIEAKKMAAAQTLRKTSSLLHPEPQDSSQQADAGGGGTDSGGPPSTPAPGSTDRKTILLSDDSYRLTGSVSDGLMTDVLQMLASNQKTGRFSLFLEESQQRFDLYMDEGEFIAAQTQDKEGEAAFFGMMVAGHSAGQYGFVDGVKFEGERNIDGKAQFLILEALRRIDEEHGDGT